MTYMPQVQEMIKSVVGRTAVSIILYNIIFMNGLLVYTVRVPGNNLFSLSGQDQRVYTRTVLNTAV